MKNLNQLTKYALVVLGTMVICYIIYLIHQEMLYGSSPFFWGDETLFL